MVWDDGEFVQDKGVGQVVGREVGDQQVWRWVFEWVWFGGFRSRWFTGLEIGRLLGQGRTVAELELDHWH